MAQDRKVEAKESKTESVAEAHRKAEANAQSLQKAIAFLIYQAETEMQERTREERIQLALAEEGIEKIRLAVKKANAAAEAAARIAARVEIQVVEEKEVIGIQVVEEKEVKGEAKVLGKIGVAAQELEKISKPIKKAENIIIQVKGELKGEEGQMADSPRSNALNEALETEKKAREAQEEAIAALHAVEQAVEAAQLAKKKEEKHTDPPIIHPVTAYGYATPGGAEFKKLVDNLRAAANDCTSDIPLGPDEKKSTDNKGVAAFEELFEKFEDEVKDIQNGWMMGNPVEVDALKRKAEELQAKLDPAFEGLKEEKSLNPRKLQRIKDQLADFPANVDKAVGSWRRRAKEQVRSNASVIIHRKMLEVELKPDPADVYEFKRELGHCDILRLSAADIKKLQGDKGPDFKEFEKLPLTNNPDSPSTRAWVLVNDRENKLDTVFYINKTTKEITNMPLKEDQKAALQAQFNEPHSDEPYSKTAKVYNLYNSKEGFGWRLPPRVSPRESTLDGTPQYNSTQLQPSQEKWIEDIIKPAPDWKKTLPCAYGDSTEMAQRVREEKEYIAYCKGNKDEADHTDIDQGKAMARDKALERLEKSKNESMEYDVGGEIFRVERREHKDEDGHKTGEQVFHVRYLGEDGNKLHGSNPKAMAALVDLCFKRDPLTIVELDCDSFSRQPAYKIQAAQIKIEKQVEQAIKHAEKLAKRGVYIAIELSPNVKAVLSAVNSKKGLEARADKLLADWRKYVKQPQKEKQHEAAEKFTASKEGGIGTLLATEPPPNPDSHLGGLGALLDAKLKSRDNDPEAAKDKKLEEVKTEVIKLHGKVKQTGIASHSIQEQLRDMKNELDQDRVRRSPTELEKLASRLEGLRHNHETVEQDLAKLAKLPEQKDQKEQKEEKNINIAVHYGRWLVDSEVRLVLGVDVRAEKPDIPDGKTEAKFREENPDIDKKCKAFEKRETYYKLVKQVTTAGANASAILEKHKANAQQITALKGLIESCQAAVRREMLEEKKAEDAQPPVQRPG